MDSLVMGRTCSGPLFMQLLFYSKSKAEKLVRLPAKQPVLLLFIVYEKKAAASFTDTIRPHGVRPGGGPGQGFNFLSESLNYFINRSDFTIYWSY